MALDDRGPQLAAVTLFFVSLAALTVTLLCFVRLFILKVFQVEDWLAVASMVNKPTLPLEGGGQLLMELGANRDKASFVAYTAIVMHTISYGAGKHLAAVPVEHIPLALKVTKILPEDRKHGWNTLLISCRFFNNLTTNRADGPRN